MAKKKDLTTDNEIFVAQKLAEDELNTNEINEPLERLDFKSFDNNKELLDYQQQALINAFRMLVAYFRDFKENKKEFYAFYQERYSFAHCDFAKKKLNHLLKNSFKVENGCVKFENFINRLAFYMATGSGKTIVIIKLVELLSVAMGMGLIPKKNIMFFSANENLIQQFEKEIEKYNRNKDYSKQIDFKNLKSVKNKDFYHTPKDFLMKKIVLFYYRADLMNDEESKENLLNYKDCWDNGENYVILDEAHKGNKTESKRQAIFSLLSLKGFLFNFSATFTEESDLITAVYNLSVGEWVKLGYGKESVLLKKNNLNAFKELKDLNDREKEIALLKALLLLGMQKRYKTESYFYDPLMLVFTHSVNVKNSDAEIFFKTLARVIENDDGSDFLKAKDELLEELKGPEFLFSDGKDQNYKIEVFKESLNRLDFKGLKEAVFYASNGHIEVIINPKNNQEIAFKLNTSDKVFCLIRIGDITEWIREKLKSVKVVSKNLSFKEESYFSQIDKSSINILVGSRAFDTGWDSTRPSVILFLNIGLDDDAKKLVKQSFGRGVRIESIKNQRQRLAYLEIDGAIKKALKPNAAMLETLFVIPTNHASLEAILKFQKESENKGENRGSWREIKLEKTPIKHALFVPCYRKEPTSILKKESVKKALSFELLSQRKRLKGFNQNWQRVRLGDIANYLTSNLSAEQITQQGKIKVYDVNNFIGYTNTTFISDKPYISIVKDGSVGRVRILPPKTNILSTMGALIANHKTTTEFLFYLLSNFDFKNFTSGSIIPHIYFKDYKEKTIFLPPLNEQIAIANILSDLDSEIISLKNKKRQFDNIKKALNHDLMSAKIRVLKK